MQRWTLITGATSGIGLALAEKFAKGGHHLILVGRNSIELEKAAKNLKDGLHIQVKVMIADLAVNGAGTRLAKELESAGLEIECLVNNAGFGLLGPFIKTNPVIEEEMINVNIISLVELTKALLRPMVLRKSGRILNVASMAGFQPGPYMAVYYASKAFVLSFSLALNEENRKSGVTVTVLCPGPTRTNFFGRAGINHSSLLTRISMEASAVAKTGYLATMRGDALAIPGIGNRLVALSVKFLPTSWVVRAVARIQKSLI